MKKKYNLILLFTVLAIGFANAQFANIYTFDTVPQAYPYGSVTVSGNKLFGVGLEGGKNGFGFVFSINRDGSNYADLWDFNDTASVAGNSNGADSYGNLTIIGNRVYGFAPKGGSNSRGLIYSMNKDGSAYKDLYDFVDSTGAEPGWGALKVQGDKFYGMARVGGKNGYGVIFSVDTNGKGYKDIWNFNDSGYVATNSNGANPQDIQLVMSGNKLFGMTSEGGASDSGLIFSIDTNGTGFRDLYDLNNTSGGDPFGHLTMAGDKLYGMTYYGGVIDSGTVFSVDTNGSGFKVLVNFDRAKGCHPFGSLTYARGKMYGMTSQGGDHDKGTVFSIDTNGNAFMDLHDFSGVDGLYPYGNNLTLSQDTLFGMTYGGGVNGYGNIFYYVDTTITNGIKEISVHGSMQLYPNPNNGNFTIACNVESSVGLVMEVYNVFGEKVYTNSLRNTKGMNPISLGTEADGVYLYKVVTLDGSVVKQGKIVVTK